jgi:hypothetical protein
MGGGRVQVKKPNLFKFNSEDFTFVLFQISRGEHLEAVDLLSAVRYARGCWPEIRLLMAALITGYAAHQDRIQDKNAVIAELQRTAKQEDIA